MKTNVVLSKELPAEEVARLQSELPVRMAEAVESGDRTAVSSARARIAVLLGEIEDARLLEEGQRKLAERASLAADKQRRREAAQRRDAVLAKVPAAALSGIERPLQQLLEGLDAIDALHNHAVVEHLSAGGEPGIRMQFGHRRRTAAISIVRRVLDRLGSQVNPMLMTNEQLYSQGIRTKDDGKWTSIVTLLAPPPLTTVDDHEREGVPV